VRVCAVSQSLSQRTLLVGPKHPLDVEDDGETLVDGRKVDPDRVPHALVHGDRPNC